MNKVTEKRPKESVCCPNMFLNYLISRKRPEMKKIRTFGTIKYDDLVDMVIEMTLLYSETEHKLEKKHIDSENPSYWSMPGLNELGEVISTLKFFLPENIETDFKAKESRMKSITIIHSIEDEELSSMNDLFEKNVGISRSEFGV